MSDVAVIFARMPGPKPPIWILPVFFVCWIMVAVLLMRQKAALKKLTDRADQCYRAGRYPEAASAAEQAVHLAEKQTYSSSDRAQCAGLLSVIYRAQGRYDEAEALLKRVIEIHQAASPKSVLTHALDLDSLGGLYAQQRRYAEAEDAFKRSLALYEEGMLGIPAMYADTVENLAQVYREQGKRSEADALVQRSNEMRSATSGGGWLGRVAHALFKPIG